MKGVSFRLSREKLGIVSESGSGKSTVLRTVMGLNRDWSGDIRILDIDVRDGRRQISCASRRSCSRIPMPHSPRYTIAEPMRINRVPMRVAAPSGFWS